MKSGQKYFFSAVALSAVLCFTCPLLHAQDTARSGQDTGSNIRTDSVGNAQLPVKSDAVSFAELLPGTPGVYATEAGSIASAPLLMIRGINTINLNPAPQVFVDGIPVKYSRALPPFLSVYEPTRFGFVNPNDIDRIHVAAAAMDLSEVGGRGTNGAIYLTTKRGEFGGTKIDFKANYGISSNVHKVERMDAGAFRSYLRDIMKENNYSDEEIQANPVFNSSLPQYSNNTDWINLISRKAHFRDYYLSLKGGDGDANYLFSVGYTNKEEMLQNAGLDRVSLRFNLDYKLSPRFEITNNLSYSNVTYDYFEQGYNWDIHPIYVAATKAPFLGKDAYSPDGTKTSLLANVDELGKSNPWALVKNMKNNNEENRVDGLIGAKWQVAGDLYLNSSMSVSYFNMQEKQYRPALGIVSDEYRIRQNSKRNSSEFTLLWNTYLDKAGSWSNWGRYAGKIGTWIETYEERSVFARKVNAGTDDYETLRQGIADSISNTKFRYNLMTFYARGEIDLKERIFISANLNAEGISNFGPKGRWNFYPGLKIAGDLFQRIKPNRLLLRAGWGMSGNHDVRNYYHYNLYYPANYFGYGGAYLGNVANENFGPEKTTTFDGGLTAHILNNRVVLDAGYYYRKTSDLITYKSIPVEIGLDPQFENNGAIISQGLEAGFNVKVVEHKDFSWTINGNVSTLNNVIDGLPNGNIIHSLDNVEGIAWPKEKMSTFYGYKVLGVFQSSDNINLNKADGTRYQPGDYVIEDINGDAKINEQDKQIIGSALPRFFGGFGTSGSYKGLSLYVKFSYAYGQDIYNRFKQKMHMMSDFSNQSSDVDGRFRSETYPGAGLSRSAFNDPSGNGAASDLWIENGSYIRLKSATISYEVPVAERIKFIKNLQISITGENLLTFTKYSGADPEIVSSFHPLIRGIDFGASPLPRVLLFGIKASL